MCILTFDAMNSDLLGVNWKQLQEMCQSAGDFDGLMFKEGVMYK